MEITKFFQLRRIAVIPVFKTIKQSYSNNFYYTINKSNL